MEQVNLNETLKELRKINNLSQENLADLLHVSRQSLSKWERGEASPDIYTLNKMAEFYKISLDDIMKGNIHKEVILKEEPVKQQEKQLFSPFWATIITLIMFGVTVVYPILFNTITLSPWPMFLLEFSDKNVIQLIPIILMMFVFLYRTLISFREKNNFQTLINLIGLIILALSSYYMSEAHAVVNGSTPLNNTYYAITSMYAVCFIITLLAFKNKFLIRSNNIALNIGFLIFTTLSVLTIFDSIIPSHAGVVFIILAIFGLFLLGLALIEKTGLKILNIISITLLVFAFVFGFLILASVLIKEWLFITIAATVTVVPLVTLIINLSSNTNLEPLSEKLKQWNNK